MLDALFCPKSIALVGASSHPGKLGYEILNNLIKSGYANPIYPINPKTESVLSLPCFPNIQAVSGPIDLAIIAIPAQCVIDVLKDCGECGVKAAIVISAGFRETGHEGLMAEMEMARIAERYGMVVVGPNCLGVMDTATPMNASFAADMALSGSIAFMSQSGAVCTAVLDTSLDMGLGFSKFVSLGNKAHLNELHFLEAWKTDEQSNVIMAYLEGISDGRKFVNAARVVTKHKPLVAIKAGVTNAGSKAVSSHTGTLAGSEKAYHAAFMQSGVIRVGSIEELLDISRLFALQPLPKTDDMAVLTNAGGPGILATDAMERSGLRLASLSKRTMDTLAVQLPPAASVLNPVDILGDARADRYRLALQALLEDENVSAVLVILTPQIMTEIEETARIVVELSNVSSKAVVACFMGEKRVKHGISLLSAGGVPNYPSPDRAVRGLKAMCIYRDWQTKPLPVFPSFELDRGRLRAIFDTAKRENRLEMGETEARAVLEACAIPVPASKLCASAEEAVDFAESIGYPVVLKIASPDILHKTDIGGVRMNLLSASAVRDAFELITLRAARTFPEAEIWGCLVQKQIMGDVEVIVGMHRDPQFGPLVMFGLGGIYVETLKDVSFRLAPFSREEAKEMISEVRSAGILYGVRGRKRKDIEAVVEVLLKVSYLVTEFPEIVELDINPLMVFDDGRGVMALDMRLVIS
ncbi:MAG: acetate--CoA ligase family protein [Dissulfuribacterales bacterium]